MSDYFPQLKRISFIRFMLVFLNIEFKLQRYDLLFFAELKSLPRANQFKKHIPIAIGFSLSS